MEKSQERKLLREVGFVHVTGLTARKPNGQEYRIGEFQTSAQDVGRWQANNSTVAVLTSLGEVWIAISSDETTRVAREVSPNGQGGFVPCSNGEQIETLYLLARLADPDWKLSH